MLNGAGIFTYMKTIKIHHSWIGKYASSIEHLGWVPMGSVVSSCSHHGRLQVLEALKERRTLPVSNSLAEMAVPQPPKTRRVM